ncbi:hypothetical protein FHG87_000791 [Trinorchestia longiramus]|nr:hypothetical protein FHG87_000791 [Trinorchestia longiramus]
MSGERFELRFDSSDCLLANRGTSAATVEASPARAEASAGNMMHEGKLATRQTSRDLNLPVFHNADLLYAETTDCKENERNEMPEKIMLSKKDGESKISVDEDDTQNIKRGSWRGICITTTNEELKIYPAIATLVELKITSQDEETTLYNIPLDAFVGVIDKRLLNILVGKKLEHYELEFYQLKCLKSELKKTEAGSSGVCANEIQPSTSRTEISAGDSGENDVKNLFGEQTGTSTQEKSPSERLESILSYLHGIVSRTSGVETQFEPNFSGIYGGHRPIQLGCSAPRHYVSKGQRRIDPQSVPKRYNLLQLNVKDLLYNSETVDEQDYCLRVYDRVLKLTGLAFPMNSKVSLQMTVQNEVHFQDYTEKIHNLEIFVRAPMTNSVPETNILENLLEMEREASTNLLPLNSLLHGTPSRGAECKTDASDIDFESVVPDPGSSCGTSPSGFRSGISGTDSEFTNSQLKWRPSEYDTESKTLEPCLKADTLESKSKSTLKLESESTLESKSDSTSGTDGESTTSISSSEAEASIYDSECETPESDLEFSTPESDLEFSTPESDLEFGTPESDLEFGTPESDLEFGTPESDLEFGTPESDLEFGTPESDLEFGTPGFDLEFGTPGSDLEFSSPGSDLEFTRTGADKESVEPDAEFECVSADTEFECVSPNTEFELVIPISSPSQEASSFSSTPKAFTSLTTDSLLAGKSTTSLLAVSSIPSHVASSTISFYEAALSPTSPPEVAATTITTTTTTLQATTPITTTILQATTPTTSTQQPATLTPSTQAATPTPSTQHATTFTPSTQQAATRTPSTQQAATLTTLSSLLLTDFSSQPSASTTAFPQPSAWTTSFLQPCASTTAMRYANEIHQSEVTRILEFTVSEAMCCHDNERDPHSYSSEKRVIKSGGMDVDVQSHAISLLQEPLALVAAYDDAYSDIVGRILPPLFATARDENGRSTVIYVKMPARTLVRRRDPAKMLIPRHAMLLSEYLGYLHGALTVRQWFKNDLPSWEFPWLFQKHRTMIDELFKDANATLNRLKPFLLNKSPKDAAVRRYILERYLMQAPSRQHELSAGFSPRLLNFVTLVNGCVTPSNVTVYATKEHITDLNLIQWGFGHENYCIYDLLCLIVLCTDACSCQSYLSALVLTYIRAFENVHDDACTGVQFSGTSFKLMMEYCCRRLLLQILAHPRAFFRGSARLAQLVTAVEKIMHVLEPANSEPDILSYEN